jgi:hypothetical protein
MKYERYLSSTGFFSLYHKNNFTAKEFAAVLNSAEADERYSLSRAGLSFENRLTLAPVFLHGAKFTDEHISGDFNRVTLNVRIPFEFNSHKEFCWGKAEFSRDGDTPLFVQDSLYNPFSEKEMGSHHHEQEAEIQAFLYVIEQLKKNEPK